MRSHQLLLFFLICFSLSNDFAYAKAQACEHVSSRLPELELIDDENEIIYDFTLGTKDLKKLQKQARLIITGDTYGLTSGVYKYQLFIMPDFKRLSSMSNKYCPGISKIFIRFMYESTIYVAKEFNHGSCSFRTILDHEMQHHEINVTNKKKYLKWLKSDLQSIAGAIISQYKPVKGNNMQSVFNDIQTDLKDAIDVYIHKMHVDTKIANQRLDSVSEYLRIGRQLKRCNNAKK